MNIKQVKNPLSPIILFVYNRPDHTKRTITALKKNALSSESDLIVYSDGAKSSFDLQSVAEVKNYIKSIDGFKSVKIVDRKSNWGLAKSIIHGVSSVVNEYGRVIVLEDDIVTSPAFLSYMNAALDHYIDKGKIWHISGWNYPIDNSELEDVYFSRIMNCWGWATWVDRWNNFEKNAEKCINSFTKDDIKYFNLDGYHDFWSQVVANKNREIDTWAIFWYTTIFKNEGLCLFPSKTYVKNIGNDGTGVHCGTIKEGPMPGMNDKFDVKLSNSIIESRVAINKIKSHYRISLFHMFIRIVRNTPFYTKIKKVFKIMRKSN